MNGDSEEDSPTPTASGGKGKGGAKSTPVVIEDTVCEVCRDACHEKLIILCDECNLGMVAAVPCRAVLSCVCSCVMCVLICLGV